MSTVPLLVASLTLALFSSAPIRAQTQWQPVPHTPPHAAAMTWDGGLGAPVMLGGDPYSSVFQHLYGPGGRISSLPVPVGEPSLAYDAARDVLLVFGQTGSGWTIFEGREQWTTVAAPWANALIGATIVYDPVRAVHVIAGYAAPNLQVYDWNGTTAVLRQQVPRLGGSYVQAIHHAGQGRTWLLERVVTSWLTSAYDGATLQPLPGTAPAISSLRCVYDPLGNRLLAFGGYNGILISPGNVSYVTWAYDGAVWSSLGTSPVQPGLGRACTDPQGRAVAHAEVLRQGSSWIPRPALHEWNGAAWSLVPGSESPAVVRSHSDSVEAQLDPTTGRTLVGIGYSSYYSYYGYQTGVWYEWDDQRFTSTAPPPGVLIGFHEGVGRHVAFGYVAGQPRTWHRVNGSWSLVATSGPPPGPFWGWAWDGTAVILFGSRAATSGLLQPETWAWDGQAWTLRTTSHAPGPRQNPKMVFDASRRRVVLFGGSLWNQPLADTWEWDGADWNQRAQGPMPPALPSDTSLLWHAKRARTVLQVRTGTVATFWEWNGTVWQPAAVGLPASGAPGRLLPTAAGDLLHIGVGVDRYDSAFPASYRSIGAGCSGSSGVPTLATALHDQPWLGDWITVRLGSLPPAAAVVFLLTGFSTTSWAGVPLPLDLAPLGAPSCTLRVAADVAIPLPAGNGEASWGTAVPMEPALLGVELHQQPLVPDPSANAFGWVLGNAATLRIGRR